MIQPQFILLLALLVLAILSAQDVVVDVQVETEDTANLFPLLRFATMGDVGSVADLLKQGADVNERLENGVTAAHAAARYNHNNVLSVVRTMLVFFSLWVPHNFLFGFAAYTSGSRFKCP